jgi:hypothetical protein
MLTGLSLPHCHPDRSSGVLAAAKRRDRGNISHHPKNKNTLSYFLTATFSASLSNTITPA